MNNDPSERLEERGVKQRSPDLVIALKATKSVSHFKTEFDLRHSERRLRHSPFKKSGLLYPFIIVESKGEERSPGFEAIQRQTAFPIRTCLQLQQNLQRESGEPLNPLVWFFAYQADEWRVSACVMHEGKYKIFDLWINRVMDSSGALQLLRIVDYIADWARDIYRLDILSCLAGGRQLVLERARRRSESANTYGSRLSVPPFLPQDNPCLKIGNLESNQATQPLAEDSNDEDAFMEDSPPVPRKYNEDTVKCEEPASHPFLRWMAPSDTQPNLLARKLTIRHSNMILFKYVHLPIPENAKELVDFLKGVARLRGASTKEIAAALWRTISSQATSVATTTSRIDQIKSDWLKLTPMLRPVEKSGVRALFSFRSLLRSNDWQVVREIRCISCTYLAAQKLASLAGVVSVVSTEWAADASELTLPLFRALKSLTARDSVTAAATPGAMYLQLSANASLRHFWVFENDVEVQTRSCFACLSETYRANFEPMLEAGSKMMAVIPKPIPPEIRRLFVPSPFPSASAVLLRRENHGTDDKAAWCLMVLEELDFRREQVLGRTLAKLKTNGEVFTLRHLGDEMTASSSNQLEPDTDISCIDWWIEKLLS